MKTGIEPPTFETQFRSLKLEALSTRGIKIPNAVVCMACNVAAKTFIFARRLGASKTAVAKLLTLMCYYSKFRPKDVCEGMVDANIVRNLPSHKIICRNVSAF